MHDPCRKCPAGSYSSGKGAAKCIGCTSAKSSQTFTNDAGKTCFKPNSNAGRTACGEYQCKTLIGCRCKVHHASMLCCITILSLVCSCCMTTCVIGDAVKASAKIAGRVFQWEKNHVGQQHGQMCATFQGTDRYGAIVLQPKPGFNPRQVGCREAKVTSDVVLTYCKA